jgi:hypothetical protein
MDEPAAIAAVENSAKSEMNQILCRCLQQGSHDDIRL